MTGNKYTYVADVEHVPTNLEFDTLQDAIFAAMVDFEYGNAWPSQLVSPSGFLLWESSGPFKTAESLKAFGAIHGVEWPL